jgi:hypothetical protein
MTSTDLEIDISDSELAEIMPRLSPNQTLIPITMSSVSLLTSEVLDLQSAEMPKPDISTATKKPRKPRVSKKATPSAATPSAATPSAATPAESSVDGPSVATSSTAAKSGTPGKSAITEQQFTLGLTRECFTVQELAINPLTQIFIENSRVTNNELIKYQAVKAGILDYKCYGKGCPTKDGNWRRKLGFLILVRNNNRETDLRITNLSFMCPNCYCQEKGSQSFEKVKKEIVRTCAFCNTPLDNKYNSDKCGRCAWQIKNQIQKSTNIDRLSRAFGTEVDGLSASNMAILMNSSILDSQSGADIGTSLHKYSGTGVSSSGSGIRITARSVCNPVELKIENSAALKRLFMELSEQV